MTDQIWANSIRFYAETFPRSGVPVGDVFTIPIGPAAAAKRVDVWAGRTDFFRNAAPMQPLLAYYEGKMTLSVGIAFLAFILKAHASQDGLDWRFDRNAPTPTFALEIQTADDAFGFFGVAFSEIQVGMDPPELAILDLTFFALDRRTIDVLTTATADLYSEPLAANRCCLAFTTGTWGADPRVDDFLDGVFSSQLYFSRRDLEPARFMPDGRAAAYTSAPWRIMADINLAWSELVRTAKTRALGKLKVFIGAAGADLVLTAGSVSMFSDPDPIKSIDFREENLMVDCHQDSSGSVLSFRDNSF